MKKNIDRSLAECLNELWAQNEVLKSAERLYLELEGNKKSMLAQITARMDGKSHAEKETKALASQDWRDFVSGHVEAETAFNYERRKFDILDKAFYAAHSSYKLDERSIRRPGA